MTFYVASGVSNAKRVNEAAAVLSAAGHTRTYDWTTHGDVSAETAARKGEVASRESRGVESAELVVLLLPGRYGTHAELGMAIASAAQKRILLWSETNAPFDTNEGFCVFYHHPRVERFACSFADFLGYLAKID